MRIQLTSLHYVILCRQQNATEMQITPLLPSAKKLIILHPFMSHLINLGPCSNLLDMKFSSFSYRVVHLLQRVCTKLSFFKKTAFLKACFVMSDSDQLSEDVLLLQCKLLSRDNQVDWKISSVIQITPFIAAIISFSFVNFNMFLLPP